MQFRGGLGAQGVRVWGCNHVRAAPELVSPGIGGALAT